MRKRKVFSGEAVRTLRQARRITQAELARRLGISTSYLNQIEHNQRPLTAGVLLELSRVFRVDAQAFSDDEQDRLLLGLKDALADPALGAGDIPAAEIKAVAQSAPGVARALLRLQADHRALLDRYQSLDDALSLRRGAPAATVAPNLPYDEVRDFFHDIGNYVDSLDTLAEARAARLPGADDPSLRLARALEQDHRVAVALDRDLAARRPMRRFDPATRRLQIDAFLEPASQRFAMAHQLALLEAGEAIEEAVAGAGFASPDSGAIARIALANYYAGALMLPYGAFLRAASDLRHDVSALAALFGASLEQVCHRLSTLQRPGQEGIPFYFLRVDRAGNITKRHSATRVQFARYGGACPLWNIHEAFETPDRMLVQMAEMPDGTRYLSMATGVTKAASAFGAPRRRYAIGFGCELAYADRLVYGDGLDWQKPRALTPIGVSCRLCDRPDCAQRAYPPVGRRLAVDRNRRGEVPYELP
ncbi:helix-turn-helix domain-containing protein [Rubellimicrobium roseum]|uniref:ImmA/IrrE family metallo-endopeptidase n=1 Tax=Rubellimicrobium roseum TaxID=687525 RepID=A0A5C4NP75_9RHOB|nr:short-chain fatty acyl-CoA regulator family protein [Rubellimicrobium roseum]TNC74189.1 ImmA/IrrE family metallo-endopeptidase [Rubellimicrobium roseum]